MPHVLWELQGQRTAKFSEFKDAHGTVQQKHDGYVAVSPGSMTALEYDNAIGDLVAYMQWMGEPAQGQRVRLGVWVLMFLAVFTVIAWRLNASFWKDIK
jgi:ubiquinol-cytochrome c reductase cytochrome c1 subunit